MIMVAAFGYRVIWTRTAGVSRTPTGFGVLLAPVLLVSAIVAHGSPALIYALALTTLATCIYWIDDLRELGAWTRVAISALAGIGIGSIYLFQTALPPAVIAALVLLTGVVNVATVNLVNFQDGADLNLATFVLLTSLLLAGYSIPATEWLTLAAACAAFIVPFGVFNRIPHTLYLGDSGSFAFGALLTILGVAFISGHHMPPPEAAIPAALPLVDTAFVTARRIRIRQRFTERHYFHLYQRLQRGHRGFAYLLPQLANVSVCLVAAELLQRAGAGRVISVGAAAMVVSLATYGVCRRFFVTGEPGPPFPREARA
jgi:UDP-N-acetylmuramyl pentapeptide phosphotransferase/UDP-N-acetylglucosamine-1-phosphate transferase